jgi:hypothetical protein
MEDYDDNNGKNKEGPGYLATYARIKSMRHEGLSPAQEKMAQQRDVGAGGGSGSSSGAGGQQDVVRPDALARQASLSRRSSHGPPLLQPTGVAVSALHPAMQGQQPRPSPLLSSPFAATTTSGHSSFDMAGGGGPPSPRAGPAAPMSSSAPSHYSHERWWARMDSASFNAPRAPEPGDPAPLAPPPRSTYRDGGGGAAGSGGGGGSPGPDDEGSGGGGMWSPYSLRRRSSAAE